MAGNINKKISTTFSRGLNQAASQTIEANECAIAQNFIFKNRAAEVRTGIAVYGSLPAPVVSLRKFYKPDNTNYFCAIAGGVFYNAVTSGTFTSVSSQAISGAANSEVYAGAVYFTDYSTPVKFFDGKLIGVAGLSSPIFRTQINDFENINQFTANTFGAMANDFTYVHRDLGTQSILFSASSPSNAAVFTIGGGTEIQSQLGPAIYSNRRGLTRDLSGNINVVFTSGNVLYHAQSLNKGSTWTNTVIDNQVVNLPFSTAFSLSVDSSNNLHSVVAINGTNNLAYYKRDNLSGWGSSVIISGVLGTDKFANGFNNVVDMSSNIHIVWGQNLSGPTFQPPHNGKIQYVEFINATSSWTSVSTLASTSNPFLATDNLLTLPQTNIFVDHSNIVHSVWAGWAQISTLVSIYYQNSQNTSAWNITSGSPFSAGNPVLGVDTSANIHVLWMGDTSSLLTGNNQLHYRKFTNSTSSWSAITRLTTENYTQYNPNISLESNNKIHVMWQGNSVQSPSLPTIRYITNLSGWSAIQNLNQNFNAINIQVGMAYSIHPLVSGNRINRPNTGWAIAYLDQNSVVNYHASFDLTWGGDPPLPQSLDLTHFASDTSSDLNDIIEVFTVHDVKANISSLVLQFIDASTFTASQEITNLSSWQSCSNDQWALTHSIPKATMVLSNTSFNWASCHLGIQMTCVSTSGGVTAFCNIDNLRMVKTPPIIDYSVSTKAQSNLLFFGSSATTTALAAKVTIASITPVGTTFGVQPVVASVVYTDGSHEILPIAEAYRRWGAQQSVPVASDPALEGLKMIADPLPNDTYFYKATFLKASPNGFEIESNPTNVTSSFIVSSPTSSWTYIHLTDIPIAPNSMGVVGRRIYRRRQSDNDFQNVYTIHDNVKTNFLDTIPAATLGKTLEVDHTPPPQATIIKKSSQQLVYYMNVVENGTIYPSRIRWSKPYEPYYCPLNNLSDINPDDGTVITGAFEFQGIMHILKTRSTWLLDSAGSPSNIHTTIGCIAQNSVAVGRNEVFWLSEDGVIRYRLYRFDNISHSLDKKSLYRIQKILDRLPKQYISQAQGIYYNGFYLLAVTDVGSTTNNTVLCYDVDNDVWSEFPNLNVNCWETWQGSQEGYRLFFGNNSGLVCEFFTGNYDISTPIYSTIQSRDFGIPSPTEFFRKAFLFMQDFDGLPKTINIQPIYDFVLTSSNVDSQIQTLTSGQNALLKSPLPMTDDASFFSLNIQSSGRYRINQVDIYGREEKLR